MIEKNIKVAGMHCNSCKVLIEDALYEIKGVQEVSANFQNGKVIVKYEGNLLDKIKNSIEKEGYKVEN